MDNQEQQATGELPKGVSLGARYLASAALGIVLFLFYGWRFLPYSERERHEPNWWVYLALMVAAGYLLTMGLRRKRFRVCHVLLLTLCLANAVLITIDCSEDPTNHNLMPFEFVMIALATLPAYAGAGIGALVERVTRGRGGD